MSKPNCNACVHRSDVPGTTHSRCNNPEAHVIGHPHGRAQGWFRWPVNYDPVWLIACDGFSEDPADKKPPVQYDPLVELLGLLR